MAHHTFEAPIDRVWAMFIDKDSHIAKFEGMGHREVELLESDFVDDVFTIKITRLVDVELPGFAKKVLKPTNTVVTTDEWRSNGDGTYGGHFELDTIGAPVDVKGTTRITPDGDRTAYRLTFDFNVNVPIIGGKIANWARTDVEKQIALEFEAGDKWLASHP